MVDLERDMILDDASDPALNRIAELATSIFSVPIASVCLHTEERVWCKSAAGLDQAKKLHKTSCCAHVLKAGESLVVADVAADERFCNDLMAVSSPPIGFYAGVPLKAENGRSFGVLHIADIQPRAGFEAIGVQQLQDLAALVVDQIELGQERTSPAGFSAMSSAALTAMSHDIRTPMNGVLGMAEVLLTADDLSDRHRRRVQIIKQSGQDLLGIIDQLLELARIESENVTSNPTSFDLEDMVNDALAEMSARCCSKSVELDSMEKLPRLAGDASGLKRLLRHFLESAVAFASEDVIRAHAEMRPTKGNQLRVRFEIEDTSIDGARIERILAAVERGNLLELNNFGKADLGPIICKTLASKSNGAIGVDGQADGSFVFWLDISLETSATPIVSSESPRTANADESHTPPKTIRDVLVAEDNPDMAYLIEDLLDEAGYSAIVAHDGASVLRILDEQHVDVVLMDGRMPDMSGFEATKLIRQLPDERADVPIIALTAEAMTGDRERFLAAGMDDYVAKPVDYEALLGAIERCSHLRRQEATGAAT